MRVYRLMEIDMWGRDFASVAFIEEPKWATPDEACPKCYEPVHRLRTGPHAIAWEAGSDVIGDLVCTGASDSMIVTERVKLAFEQAGLTGYDAWPAILREPAKRRPSRRLPMVAYPYTGPPLWDIHPREFVHIIPEQSTVEFKGICPACGRQKYWPLDIDDQVFVIDPRTWRGWDFMRSVEMGTFVTQRVVDVIEKHQFTNFRILPRGRIGD